MNQALSPLRVIGPRALDDLVSRGFTRRGLFRVAALASAAVAKRSPPQSA
jgi:hypothetical protein